MIFKGQLARLTVKKNRPGRKKRVNKGFGKRVKGGHTTPAQSQQRNFGFFPQPSVKGCRVGKIPVVSASPQNQNTSTFGAGSRVRVKDNTKGKLRNKKKKDHLPGLPVPGGGEKAATGVLVNKITVVKSRRREYTKNGLSENNVRFNGTVGEMLWG